MGANLAGEVADENFCETTIGCKNTKLGPSLRDIIQTDYFRVVVVDDEDTVEVCGALKVIVQTIQSTQHLVFQSRFTFGQSFLDGFYALLYLLYYMI